MGKTDPIRAAAQGGKPLRILALTIYYPPEPGANARIVYELATEWKKMGHEVTVLTDVPHYPDDKVPPEYQGGKNREETIDGVRVIRCPLIIRDRGSTLGRLANNISFALSAAWRSRKAGKADIVYVYSPPIFLGIGSWLISLLKRAPVLFNVQDIYPDVAIAHGFLTNPTLIKAFHFFEKWVYNRSRRISVISEGFRGNLLAKGVPDEKMDIVPNCVDASQFVVGERQNAFRREIGAQNQFLVVYGGNLGYTQGLETLIDAAKILEPTRPDVRIIVVGDGVEGEKLRAYAKQQGVRNLEFLGSVPRTKMPEITGAADACLVCVRAHKTKIWIQSKTYEIMAAGRPVLASLDPDGDNARLILEADAGVIAEPGDPQSLADAIVKLADDPALCERLGRNGRRHIEEFYTLQRVATLYIASMRRALEGRAARPFPRPGQPLQLLIVNQFYPPDLSPTAHLVESLAESRARAGDHVTVVASQASYVSASKVEPRRRRTDNPRVLRVWSPGLGKKNLLSRLLDYLAFYVLAWWRVMTLNKQDVIISLTTPPLIAWAAGLHTRIHRRCRMVLWSMDCYPEVAERAGAMKPGGVAASLVRFVNRRIFRRLDHLVALDGAMADLLLKEYGQVNPRLPTTIIPNWERAELFDGPAPAAWPEADDPLIRDRFVVLYLGNAGEGHQFDTVLEAAERLKNEPVTFLFVGGGAQWKRIAKVQAEKGLRNILLRGYVPKEQTPAVMEAADCALITLRDDMLGAVSPSKLHSNLAMRLPVIYIGPAGGNVDEAIQRFGCGVSLRHGDADGMVDFIRRAVADKATLEDYHRRARRAFDEAYCEAVTMPQFDRVIEGVMSKPARK